jgi:hypothetical protein
VENYNGKFRIVLQLPIQLNALKKRMIARYIYIRSRYLLLVAGHPTLFSLFPEGRPTICLYLSKK